MNEPERPQRADAQRNRALILATAEEVLAAEGLSVPIDDIARRAGVGIGTVYRHFPTKEDLFQAIVVARVQRLAEEARALADADEPGAAFFEFLRGWVRSAGTNKVIADGLADAGFDVKAMTSSAKQGLYDALEVLLVRAQEAGVVRDDVQVDDVKVLLTGTCMGVNNAGLDAAARDRTVAVVCDGLRAPAQRLAATRPARARSPRRSTSSRNP